MRFALILISLVGVMASTASASYYKYRTTTYEVTVTNITPGQSFTPILGAIHKRSISIFTLGDPASEELSVLAEGGATAPLEEALLSRPKRVSNTATTEGFLMPGKSVTYTIETQSGFNRFSTAAMLIPTNDTFFALNSVKLPVRGAKQVVYYANAYDAGSEPNDQICDNIPGPACGGTGASPEEGGEGFVHVSSGIHANVGDLLPEKYDWRNPVAKITIKRLSK